jgi:hypothetical protein
MRCVICHCNTPSLGFNFPTPFPQTSNKRTTSRDQAMADEAQADLDEALPALEAALDSLKALNKARPRPVGGAPPPAGRQWSHVLHRRPMAFAAAVDCALAHCWRLNPSLEHPRHWHA